ncbi:hypothetical protein [Citrobacter freundii]|uniref:hypothetical protein n=1 Tax=Citrobacter freundii TaxID=546 RepID=UPI001FFE087C|nr:hypothetical protein [Citrobacter freundii]
MSNIDKQALREEFQLMQDHYSDPADRECQVIYIAAEALLDELDAAEKLATQQGNIAAALLDEVTTLRRNADDKAPELRTQLIEADNELEALRQRIAELEARKFKVEMPESFYPDGDIDAPLVVDELEVIAAIVEAGGKPVAFCKRCDREIDLTHRPDGSHYCHAPAAGIGVKGE